MSGYNSMREVREVIAETLRMDGHNPRDFNVSGIARDAFYFRGTGYGYGALNATTWYEAVAQHRRKCSQEQA